MQAKTAIGTIISIFLHLPLLPLRFVGFVGGDDVVEEERGVEEVDSRSVDAEVAVSEDGAAVERVVRGSVDIDVPS